MSIRDYQRKKAVEKVLSSELRAGKFPDSITIEKEVQAEFQERPLGLPRYTFRPVKENEISNPESFNTMMENIHEDLSTAFNEIGYQNEQLLKMGNMYTTEKQQIELSLRQLEKRMQTVLNKLQHPSSHQVIYDTFDTFNHIDFRGDEKKGIPATDAFVDLRNNQVMLNTVYMGAAKIDLSQATYQIELISSSSEEKKKPTIVEETPFSHALKDTINESWRYVVHKTQLEPTAVEITIQLPAKVEANYLSLLLHSPKETTVTLFLSEDQTTWRPLKTYTAYNRVEWMFDQSITGIKLRLEKSEPDFIQGTEFEYYFGLSHIHLKKESYLPKGYVVSAPYAIDNQVVDKITLQTEEAIYPYTSISYYIGIEEEGSIVEWQKIRPNEPLYFNQVNENTLLLESNTEGYGEQVDENFGIAYYSIAKLPEAPLPKRTLLYMGDYMWKVETKQVDSVPEAYLPTLKDWRDIRGVETKFIPIELTHNQSQYELTPQSLQRFTTYVYCEKEEEIYNNDFNVGDARIQVYLNNNLIKPIVIEGEGRERYKYNYRFQKGWNKIEILTYTTTLQPFKPNLYLKDISTMVLAVKDPLYEISYYDLLNNTSKKDIGYFAVQDNQLVVNYDPKTLDVTGTGVRYRAVYRYIPEGAKEISHLRWMAILERQEAYTHATPVLKSYKLILE